MFGIDSPEILVIAIVALIVVGPKELPGLLRGWGKWMAKARGMASEFRGHVDEMVRQSELDEVKKQIVDSTAGIDLQALDPTREIKSALNEGIAEGEKALADARDDLAKPVPEITGESPAPALESGESPAPALESAETMITEAAPAAEATPSAIEADEAAPSTEPKIAPSLTPVAPSAEPAASKSAAVG
jgi:sec-independent protein translocase protein TatB